MDTTYFNRNLSVMVFRSWDLRKNIYFKFLRYETIKDYVQGIDYLKSKGVDIKAIVCDGRRGIFQMVKDIPIQMCQFHQVAIVRRYLTNNPKLEASIELVPITRRLNKSNEENFRLMLNNWFEKWETFLKEKTVNEETKRWSYTHKIRYRMAILLVKILLNKVG